MGIEDVNFRKRVRYIRRCKDVLWTRWEIEYFKVYNFNYRTKEIILIRGDVVFIKGEERNRGKWKIGIVE